jgi:hypothetical protein
VRLGIGIPEYEAKRYEERIKSVGTLLSVHSDNSDWTKRAKEPWNEPAPRMYLPLAKHPLIYAVSDGPMPRTATSSKD